MMNFSKLAHAGFDAAKLVAQHPGTYVDLAWAAGRKFCFGIIFISLIAAKMFHVYAHLTSLHVSTFLIWGSTFFLQDIVLIFLARGLTRDIHWKPLRIAAAILTVACTIGVSGLASANISFYVVTGAEIHWHQAHSMGNDAAAIRTLLSGLTGFLICDLIIIVASWFLCNYLFNGTGAVLDILGSSVQWLLCFWRKKPARPDPEAFERIECDDYHDENNDDDNRSEDMLLDGEVQSSKQTAVSLLRRLLVLLPTTVVLVLRCVRPPDPAFFFLSWSIPFVPLIDGRHHRGPPVEVSGLKGEYRWLTNQTALAPPPTWDWLPQGERLPGFEDWYTPPPNATHPQLHYNAALDPLHISNLGHDVLEPLRDVLPKVNIKHVIVIKLESTRADVFPLQEDGYVWQRLAESYGDDMPDTVKDRLANLTRNAERLTNFPSPLSKKGDRPQPYGGLSAKNAYTSGTYTLKSVVGSLCGVTPLVADFNREYKHHIYQPCMAHVLKALNHPTNTSAASSTDDFTTWPWHSMWMQSVTETYDYQDQLTTKMGYDEIVDRESLDRADAKYPIGDDQEVNYYGYADTVLREYLRDAIDDAESQHRRLFLTHLTGITHHPWGLPGGQKYKELIGHSWSGNEENMNHYLNTIGYADGWLGDILEILQEKGIANETLVVLAGDHGLSLPFDNGITPYDNPRVGNFHVPMVFAHPHLPPIEVDSPVIANQIVPTILDLLIESSSLGEETRPAAQDVRSLYEGQSIIRPLIKEEKGRDDWQFSVMNTGGSWLALRSANQPYRLVIPLIDDVEWRFTNLEVNPHEILPAIKHFDVNRLATEVERIHGPFALKWVGEATHVAQWWVAENWQRYGYDVNHPDSPKVW